MKRAIAVLALVGLAGCYQVRFTRRVEAEPRPRQAAWNHVLVNGLWGVSEPTDVHRICPEGVARVDNLHTPLNVAAQLLVQAALAVLVGGTSKAGSGGGGAAVGLQVWSPTTVRVWCAKNGSSRTPDAPPVVELATPLRLALLPIVARTGVLPEEAELFTDSLANGLRRVKNLSVVTQTDLAAVLDVEQQRQLLGCGGDNACLVELGGALGVDRIVHGSVGRIGSSLIVNLSAIDPASGRSSESVSERLVSDSNEAFFDALPALIRGLFGQKTPDVDGR